jgi:hypothetical protein
VASNIGLLTLLAGVPHTLGPFSVPAGASRFMINLDMTSLSTDLTMECDYSPDGGVTWEILGNATMHGPSASPKFAVGMGRIGDSRRVASANAQIRFVLTSTLALVSTGGTWSSS